MPRIRKLTEEPVVTYSVLDRETSPSDFLIDQDLHKDPLPQPYRRIDKILQEVLDDAWMILEKNDNDRKIELSKPKAPKFSPLAVLEGLENFNCICSSSDDNNEFLFVGSNGSLHCIDVAKMAVVDRIDLNTTTSEPNANIISIKTSRIKPMVHLLVSISETGFLFMNVFVIDRFYNIQPLVEGESDKKFRKCELTKNSDYIGFYIESKTSLTDCLIEVYKCPKEVWLQSIETIENKRQQQQLHELNNSNSDVQVASSSIDSSSASSEQQFPSLAKPSLLCKLKPALNQFKFQTVNSTNFAQLFKSTETNPDQIGVGINNCASKQHLEIKSQLAEKIFNLKFNDESNNQLNGNKNYDLHAAKLNVEFKFLPSNRILPAQTVQADQEVPISVAVCWNNSNQILFYPMGKVNKELESKYEYCMPFSSSIDQIKLTKCNNLIAVSLRNNNVVVFDFNFGIERKCAYINNAEAVKQIMFLPSTLPNKTLNLFNSVEMQVETRIACLCNDGSVYSVDCTLGSSQAPQNIFTPKLANKDDKIVHIMPCRNIPNLVLAVGQTNKVFLLSVEKSKLICELDNSEDKFTLDSQDYQLSLSGGSYQLFLKCISKQSKKSRLLCHSLKLVSVMENYIHMPYPILPNCLPLHASLNDRAKNLLKIKIEEQYPRRQKLKNVWNELSQHRNNKATKN